jgi:hypothetical protein
MAGTDFAVHHLLVANPDRINLRGFAAAFAISRGVVFARGFVADDTAIGQSAGGLGVGRQRKRAADVGRRVGQRVAHAIVMAETQQRLVAAAHQPVCPGEI